MGRGSTILFVKAPERGKVKSRLALSIGEEKTLDIYKAFILDIVGTLKKGNHSVTIAFSPENSKETVADWLGNDFEYIPQRGKDLGERMENAFAHSFARFQRALLIGSDIPDLTSALLDEAFSALEKKDAVIGPAADGGYFLIGFKRGAFLPDIFHDMAWGANSVFRDTMKIFKRAGHRVHILPEWRDVDTLDDLRSLYMRNKDTVFRESFTMAFCRAVFHD